MEVLQRKYNIPSKFTMETYTLLEFREALDPAAGLPEVDRDPGSDVQCDEYVEQFTEMMDDLSERRSAWKIIALVDDPMFYDEVAIRELESMILKDLVAKKATSRLLKIAHCIPARLATKPRITVEGNRRITQPLLLSLE